MCFSAQADVIGGVVVSALGVDALRHVRYRRELPVAALPLLFGVHQLVEAFVWWGLQGHVDDGVGKAAMWVYLIVAFVVLPVYVPLAAMAFEPEFRRRMAMVSFAVIGLGVSVALLVAMVGGPVTAELDHFHIAYGIGLAYGSVIVGLYVVATCGSLLVSSHRHIVRFGALNAAAVAVLAWFQKEGFASLWCAWAALASVAIVIHLRSEQHPSLTTSAVLV